MTQSVSAHFDGNAIIPDEPIELSAGQRLRIEIEKVETDGPRFADFSELAADLPDAPSDLANQHDHYLYGIDKQ